MGVETKISCDQCDFDLSYTANCEDYYLTLGNGSKSPWYRKEGLRGGVVTSMAISPPVDRHYTFCGIGCLAMWLTEKQPRANEQYKRLMEHRQRQAERNAREKTPSA